MRHEAARLLYSRSLDRTIVAKERSGLRRHLGACPSCARWRGDFDSALAVLKPAPFTPPPSLLASLHSIFRGQGN